MSYCISQVSCLLLWNILTDTESVSLFPSSESGKFIDGENKRTYPFVVYLPKYIGVGLLLVLSIEVFQNLL